MWLWSPWWKPNNLSLIKCKILLIVVCYAKFWVWPTRWPFLSSRCFPISTRAARAQFSFVCCAWPLALGSPKGGRVGEKRREYRYVKRVEGYVAWSCVVTYNAGSRNLSFDFFDISVEQNAPPGKSFLDSLPLFLALLSLGSLLPRDRGSTKPP